MTVKELIEQLNKIENKNMIVNVPELCDGITYPIEEVSTENDGVHLYSID